jgi:hypothetical protein
LKNSVPQAKPFSSHFSVTRESLEKLDLKHLKQLCAELETVAGVSTQKAVMFVESHFDKPTADLLFSGLRDLHDSLTHSPEMHTNIWKEEEEPSRPDWNSDHAPTILSGFTAEAGIFTDTGVVTTVTSRRSVRLAARSPTTEWNPLTGAQLSGNRELPTHNQTILIRSDGRGVLWVPSDSEKLTRELKVAAITYAFDNQGNQTVPGARSVPLTEVVPIVSVLSWWSDNQALFKLSLAAELVLLNSIAKDHEPQSIDDFGPISFPWNDDAYFVDQRIRGVNPCVVSGNIPTSTKELFSTLGISWDKNYFVCDYSRLPLKPERFREGLWIPAPVLVLKLNENRTRLDPVAILRDIREETHSIVTPQDNPDEWYYAKMCVRAADWNAHELGSHLTLAHFVAETCCLVTHQCLPQAHPIFQLLVSHFYKTLTLNLFARRLLVPNFIGKLSAMPPAECEAFCKSIFDNWNFEQHFLPKELQSRGVEPEQLPAEVYPYAASARSVWDELRNYVESVLQELDVAQLIARDALFANWWARMGECFTGFPSKMTDDSVLDSLTMIIFVCTYQHSAVNYLQEKEMSFLPCSPGFLRGRPPTNLPVQLQAHPTYLSSMLPGIQLGLVQAALVKMLSVLPNSSETLTAFRLESPSNRHYVKWQQLDQYLHELQLRVRKIAKKWEDTDRLSIIHEALAQSVLI